MFQIEKAEVSQAKAKIALVGAAGSGKTYTALVTARELGKKILVIDTENKTSSKYARLLGPYDVLSLSDYSLKNYVDALEYVAKRGYDVVIVDSLSHAWAGKGGALEQADLAKSKHGGNKFAAWGDITPLQNKLVDTILSYPTHLIATMRMKIDYILSTDGNGKQKPIKVGLGIVQRDSFEYEFDIIAQLDGDHVLNITKTRCFELDGFTEKNPGPAMGQMIAGWLSDGQPIAPIEPTYEPMIEEAVVVSQPTSNGQAESPKGKITRPMTPEQVKQSTIAKTKYTFANPPAEKQATYAFSSLSKACEGDEDARHAVVAYLFNVASMKDLTGGQCSFLIDWIGATADNGYTANPDAVKEIEAIVIQRQRDLGQVDMFESEVK